MARWTYELKCGKELREAINDGDLHDTLNMLKNAYDELLWVRKIDEDDYVSYTSGFDLYGPYADGLDEDDINYELSEFYDLCDNIGVWIPIV